MTNNINLFGLDHPSTDEDETTEIQTVIDADTGLARIGAANDFTEVQRVTQTGAPNTDPAVIEVSNGFVTGQVRMEGTAAPNASIMQFIAGIAGFLFSGEFRVQDGAQEILHANTDSGIPKFGAFGVPEVARPVVSGSQLSGAALASLLTALDLLGWIDDQTTA